MAKSISFLRFILFCLFFAVGAGAITLSIVAEEVNDYYTNKDLLKKTEVVNEKTQLLTAEYESQIRQIQNDPNVLNRLKRITIGTEPSAKDTAFPKTSDKQLAAMKEILNDPQPQQPSSNESNIPRWVKRCSEARFRGSLFFAGAGLVLVTFIFFSRSEQTPKKNE